MMENKKMSHKYKINDTGVINTLLSITSNGNYELGAIGKKITIGHGQSIVLIEDDYIYTNGYISREVIECINTHCTHIEPTICMELTKRQIDYIRCAIDNHTKPRIFDITCTVHGLMNNASKEISKHVWDTYEIDAEGM